MADPDDNQATPGDIEPAAADTAQDTAENAAQEAVGEDTPQVESATGASAAGASAPARPARELTGVVTSAKPDKTVVVRVERRVKHPVYGKFIRRSTKLAAHDEANACNEGDTVTIRQTRPISKTKRWALASIVERAGA